MNRIRWLDDIGRADLEQAGGKGANLGEMARAGFPVPPGFVVTTAAYRGFVQDNELQARIGEWVRSIQPDDPASLETAGRQIRARFQAGRMPDDVRDEVATAYRQLAPQGEAMAVRSSATAEDLPGASFAGQQDTYLNLCDLAGTLEAIQRCWGSLWTDRAIAYRLRQDIPPEAVSLAVVVQRLVPADSAGILFTANPLTGKRTEITLDATWGLGEAIVGGKVTPDHLVVDKADGRVLQQTIARKGVMTVRTETGTTEQPVPEDRQQAPVLNAEQVGQLAELGRRLEQHYGAPQDVEWAFAGGRLFVLQTRPITTLFPLPQPSPPDGELHVYFSLNAVQGVAEPLTPLALSWFEDRYRHARQAVVGPGAEQSGRPPALTVVAGRIYADITDSMRVERVRPVLLRLVSLLDPANRSTFERLLADPRLAPRPWNGPSPATRRTLIRLMQHPVRQMLHAWHQPVWAAIGARRSMAIVASDEERLAMRARTYDERLAAVDALLQDLAWLFREILPITAAGMASLFLTEALLQRWLGDSAPLMTLARGVVGNPTTEMDLDLWALAQTIGDDPASAQVMRDEGLDDLARRYRAGDLPVRLQSGLARFLARYGHRGLREIDVGQPRWAENPQHVLGVLRGYLAQTDPELAPDRHFARGQRAAEEMARSVQARLRRQPGGMVKSRLFEFAWTRFRTLGGWREYPKFCIVRILAWQHRLLWQIGEELLRMGLLDRAEDVAFLRLDEVRAVRDRGAAAGASFREIVAGRRREYEQEMRRTRIPRLLTSEGESFYGESVAPVRDGTAEGNRLRGTGVSPGTARGQVRVIRDPIGARLQPGEILVAPGTDPAWTPLFLTAGGLVMEMGGMMTHGAVVAREYGIPAVVGIDRATEILHTGQWIQIDGSSGIVNLEPEKQS